MYYLSKKHLLCTLVALASVCSLDAQVLLSEQDMVNRTVANSRNVIADSLAILQQRQLVRSAVNLPNPEFFWESPTGNFYTGSITQSVEFPTVYTRQRSLQRQRVRLATAERKSTEAEVRLQARQLYLQLQIAEARSALLRTQDSLYDGIRKNTKRLFDAGQIDYLQQLFAENQFGEVHNQLLIAEAQASAIRDQIRYIAAINDSFMVPSPEKMRTPAVLLSTTPAISMASNNRLEVLKQTEAVNELNIGLQRSKALPGLAFGYFNQGERETPLRNRFRFGLTIPLWFWQYSGNIKAARTELDVSRNRTAAYEQTVALQYSELKGAWAGNQKAVIYFEEQALSQSMDMIHTAERFLEAGQIDYINFLRTTSDAFNIRQRYLDALGNYNDSILQIQLLTGEL